MNNTAWFHAGTFAAAVIAAAVLVIARDDPADACRVQIQNSEHRVKMWVWDAAQGAKQDSRAVRDDIAKLPRWPQPLQTPWLVEVLAP